ncbi:MULTISPECIES: histidine kinase [unclassified Sedimentibacter]|uniref:histidine kinase n=1 Tax=unclassified Sedimentibacter TaxID=2649220 RepID=UPI0027DF9B0B|nr:histidine kinase [Sedimentibacter sp. MB35-C1]WMJ76880.1 histidine kinase [Sedimentibacter sp. MB35-C1]
MERIIENLMIVALISLAAYPIIKLKSFKRTILKIAATKEKALIGVFFGGLTMLGTVTAMEVFSGIKIHSSFIGPLAGGMIGGVMVGAISGIIGALFRLTVENATIAPDALTILLAGLAGGLFFEVHKKRKVKLYMVYLWALSIELINLFMILFSLQPRILSGVYFSMVGINLIIINPIGAVMLISLIKDIQYNQNLTGANYAEKSLEIAKRTLIFLKEGCTKESMEKIAQIIYDYVGIPAVALVSVSGEVTYTGHKFSTDSHIVSSQWDKGSEINHYQDFSIIRAPLWLNDEITGELHFYKPTNEIVPTDIKMIEGIAGLLSLQIQNSIIYDQEKLLIKSEYNALKAQVNPHFLYNTLNVIKTMVRMNPKKAQDLIIDLADFYRRSLSERGDMIPFIEELKLIKSYMDLQEARFGDRINLSINVQEEVYDVLFPTFAIQPLVENSIIHGMMESENHMLEIKISAKIAAERLIVNVTDNGRGFNSEIIGNFREHMITKDARIGLNNINSRLKSIYGNGYIFDISNNNGANVVIEIPIHTVGEEAKND